MDGRLKAAHVLHGQVVCVAGFEVLVENSEYLPIQDLELAHAVHHLLQGLQPQKCSSNNFRGQRGIVRELKPKPLT